jgi:tryptophan-rich sensory protein
MRTWKGLIVFLVLVACAAAAGMFAKPDAWFAALAKPPFNPPDFVFAPVWTVLYACMAVAAWRVFRVDGLGAPVGLWIAQLVFNAAWSPLFFGAHRPGWALLDIVVMWVLIGLTTVRFWRIDRPAGWLMAPYWAWVTFAAMLNAAIWHLNGGAL